ncbi:MAG: S-methyl-5'-thioadenosine phosphorylase [Candidatus Woesearchaeota archaeon]|jgi:5'-methylthioadenosine phosphorylase
MKIGIIGGSGVGDPQLWERVEKRKVHTPYGSPSDLLTTGIFRGIDIVALPRHGEHHTIQPSDVNYRANIWAMKELGVTHIIAATACGSLRENIKPGDIVFIDQFIDRTTKRDQSFYTGQVICHIPMAEPFCEKLRTLLSAAAVQLNIPYHGKGTMVTIEGPRFSSRAESELFRQWNCDVINMTTVPEVVLAREAGICYAAIAMATDYDCWKHDGENVNIELILKTMTDNAEKVKRILTAVIPQLHDWECECKTAIKTATF